MRLSGPVPGVALICLLVILPAAALAESPGEAVAARGAELRLAGRYGDAEDLLSKALDEAPDSVPVRRELAELYLEQGRFSAAAAVAEKAGEDPVCAVLAGESLFQRGRLDDAAKRVAAALAARPDYERAHYLKGMIHLERGERKEALEAFEWFFGHYAKNDIEDPEALTLVAAATVRSAELQPDVEMDFHVTMKLLDTVIANHESFLPAYTVQGELYLSVYQDMSAKKSFNQALKKNPRYPPALLGLAKQMAFRFNDIGGVEKCREAMLTNGNLYEASEFVARSHIGDSQYDDAREILEKVLAVNPRRKPARALLGAMEFVSGNRAGFEDRVKEVLADDPAFAGVYLELVGTLEQQRRFEEAKDWAKKATEVDADDFMAWWMYGRNLVHLAREKDAREALMQSRRLDPFAHYLGNAFRENMVDVLGHLEEFVETRTPNFVYKIHVGENEILTKYYHRFMEKSWDLLTKKYGFVPEGPILTEIFHIHADFAARTIGLPGIGALGACFGKVITLDSPSARKAGAFTWASTAHHEFAHVMTLQLSKGRVPRWFTEGLSVFEERQFADWWERDMDRVLFDRYMNDELYKILKFNRAFRGRDVMFAYYLGGMMCEFMVDEFGWDSIVEMLKAYGEDKQTAAVLEDVLGVSPKDYDERFKAWVGRLVLGFKMQPRWSKARLREMAERLSEEPKDLDALLTSAWAHYQQGNKVDAMSHLGRALKVNADDPRAVLLRGELAFANGRTDKAREWYEQFLDSGEDDLFARLRLAQILEGEKEFEAAKAQYEAAKKCFPSYAGANNPYLELARLKQGEEDIEGAMAEIETFVKLANTDIKHRLMLADWYESRDERERLVDVLEQIVLIYPLGEKLSMPVHVRLARAYEGLGRLEEAEIEYEVALEIGVPGDDEATVRVELGGVYLLAGKLRDARYQANTALELDPGLQAARDLLDKASE